MGIMKIWIQDRNVGIQHRVVSVQLHKENEWKKTRQLTEKGSMSMNGFCITGRHGSEAAVWCPTWARQYFETLTV